MVEFEFNSTIETNVLVEFFARCGWEDADAGTKLEWALAASNQWVLCRLDGQVIGFGRSCRLNAVTSVVFDVLVDVNFRGGGLEEEIVRLLSTDVGSLQEVSVFSQFDPFSRMQQAAVGWAVADLGAIPDAPVGAYLGRQRTVRAGGGE
jgi:hypothetical protein